MTSYGVRDVFLTSSVRSVQAMKYKLYLTKLQRGYEFNWDYSDKSGSTTLAHPAGDPGTGVESIPVALIDED